MVLTEEEARSKFCPHMRTFISDGVGASAGWPIRGAVFYE
ncbi:hypothetical protein LCGC14_1411360 [marine sediment metagenome]|uniref:Uncharacterized protein n=1 Tax=marine sediment metagenome TaxID=412755 RepID=A0A0F9JUJ3_9ZZZZ